MRLACCLDTGQCLDAEAGATNSVYVRVIELQLRDGLRRLRLRRRKVDETIPNTHETPLTRMRAKGDAVMVAKQMDYVNKQPEECARHRHWRQRQTKIA